MSQSFLLIGGQESHLVDLPEIGLQGALYRVTSVSANTGHEDPRCVGQNRVRSSQGSCGRTGAKPAGLRAESRPAHQRRPRRCRGTGPPPNTFAPRYSHSDHGRSRQSLGHPTDLPPLDAPSSALANNRAPPTGRRDVSTPARGEKLPPPRRLPQLFIPLCRSRFHTTRYRTTHFDNLRGLGNLGCIGNIQRLAIW